MELVFILCNIEKMITNVNTIALKKSNQKATATEVWQVWKIALQPKYDQTCEDTEKFALQLKYGMTKKLPCNRSMARCESLPKQLPCNRSMAGGKNCLATEV